MALLPARHGGTVARPSSQAAGRWDPFGELEDLYERMGQLMDRAFDGLWQPSGQAWTSAADLTVTVPKAVTDKPRRIEITGG